MKTWMRLIPFSVCSLSFVVLLLPRVSAAQEETRTMGFVEVLRRAREAPPSVLAAMASVVRAQAQASFARGAYIPRLTVEGGAGVTYDDHAAVPNKVSKQQYQAAGYAPRVDSTSQTNYGQLSFDYALLDLGRRGSVQAADKGVDAQARARDDVIRVAMEAASLLYLESLAAIELVADARLTLERRSNQEAAISGLVKAGLRPTVDATRAEIETVAARYGLDTREIERRASFAALAAALGLDPNQPVRPLEFEDARLPASLDPLRATEVAIERRADVRQRRSARDARIAEHRAALDARLPTVGVVAVGNASYAEIWSGTGIEGSSYFARGSLYVRWAALDPSVWRRASVTRAAITEAERQLEATVLAVRAEVVGAAYQVERTRALLAQATQVLAAAEATRTAQNQRYRAGVASLLELLDAESLEQNARRQRIEAVREHRVARLRLLASCGMLDELVR